jgi:hypothetical protein
LAQLRDELELQRKRVADAAAEVGAIRERDSIADPDPENANAVISTADRSMIAIEQQLHEQQLKVTTWKESLSRS